MRNDTPNLIVDKTIDFSLAIISYCEKLEGLKKYVISRQLLKSGTSIGANVFEAQNAESKLDFIHKMKIAAKEASETLYWLILCERSANYQFEPPLKIQLDQIIKILSKSFHLQKQGIDLSQPSSNYQIASFSNHLMISSNSISKSNTAPPGIFAPAPLSP